jgi:hypothetical protein
MDTPNNEEKKLANKDSLESLVLNKSGKLVTALYMVTNCIEDVEPIKYRLRNLGVELISQTKIFERSSSFDRGFLSSDMAVILEEIIALISVAGSVGLITDMNSNILNREFGLFRDLLLSYGKDSFFGGQPDRALSQFIVTDEMLGQSLASTPRQPEISKGQDQTSPTLTDKNKEAMGTNFKVKRTKEDHHRFDIAVKISRRNTILKLIKDKKEVTIKDISSVISDCSEKTIQRELINLVSEGVLKKVGEKRWSKYSLA